MAAVRRALPNLPLADYSFATLSAELVFLYGKMIGTPASSRAITRNRRLMMYRVTRNPDREWHNTSGASTYKPPPLRLNGKSSGWYTTTEQGTSLMFVLHRSNMWWNTMLVMYHASGVIEILVDGTSMTNTVRNYLKCCLPEAYRVRCIRGTWYLQDAGGRRMRMMKGMRIMPDGELMQPPLSMILEEGPGEESLPPLTGATT